MNVQLHYSAPQSPASINTGDLVINTDIAKDVRKFSFRDDLETFQGFEFTAKRVLTGNQQLPFYDFICTPIAELMQQEDYNNFASTRLRVDMSSQDVGGIVIAPPVGKKAYLHSISYSAYDHHQIIPLIIPEIDRPANPLEFSTGYGNAFYSRLRRNYFSAAVAKKAYSSQDNDFMYYNYRTRFAGETGYKEYATYDFPMLIRPREGTYRYQHHVAEMLYSNRKAPNSPNHFGMLSQDWAFNKFDIQINAKNATNNLIQYVWNNRGKRLPADTLNIAHSYSNDYDEFIPSVWNEINKEIDPNTTLLEVFVQRPYFFVPLQRELDKFPHDEGHVGFTTGFYTLFRLPIKVDISIIYA